jgi:hypothetical protein
MHLQAWRGAAAAAAYLPTWLNEDMPALFFFLNNIIPPSYPIHASIITELSNLLLLPAQRYK